MRRLLYPGLRRAPDVIAQVVLTHDLRGGGAGPRAGPQVETDGGGRRTAARSAPCTARSERREPPGLCCEARGDPGYTCRTLVTLPFFVFLTNVFCFSILPPRRGERDLALCLAAGTAHS